MIVWWPMYTSTSPRSKALLSAVAASIKTLLSNPPEKLPALLHIISAYQQPGQISSYSIEYLPCVCGVDSSESWLCRWIHLHYQRPLSCSMGLLIDYGPHVWRVSERTVQCLDSETASHTCQSHFIIVLGSDNLPQKSMFPMFNNHINILKAVISWGSNYKDFI